MLNSVSPVFGGRLYDLYGGGKRPGKVELGLIGLAERFPTLQFTFVDNVGSPRPYDASPNYTHSVGQVSRVARTTKPLDDLQGQPNWLSLWMGRYGRKPLPEPIKKKGKLPAIQLDFFGEVNTDRLDQYTHWDDVAVLVGRNRVDWSLGRRATDARIAEGDQAVAALFNKLTRYGDAWFKIEPGNFNKRLALGRGVEHRRETVAADPEKTVCLSEARRGRSEHGALSVQA